MFQTFFIWVSFFFMGEGGVVVLAESVFVELMEELEWCNKNWIINIV